ncbi:hypothetical protein BpHYR1_019794 [Brachionus plicatilis]|uniref:Uncharacterized protein n=1 Tax=Brachionus plicatilis TaxID=10195 RepID=A0A3M7T6H8_BRAPC|nr:hypothetical protein BpHYR1_019794 [Brachionus plicatilis]
MTKFLGFGKTQSASAGSKTTRLFCCLKGSHFSTKICCGFGGIGGRRSTTTLRAGGGNTLPGTSTVVSGIRGGSGGGASRNKRGAGSAGLDGAWRTISGGAGAICRLGSCLTTMSPRLQEADGHVLLVADLVSWLLADYFRVGVIVQLVLVQRNGWQELAVGAALWTGGRQVERVGGGIDAAWLRGQVRLAQCVVVVALVEVEGRVAAAQGVVDYVVD